MVASVLPGCVGENIWKIIVRKCKIFLDKYTILVYNDYSKTMNGVTSMLVKDVIKTLNSDVDYELLLNGESAEEDCNTLNSEVVQLDVIAGSLIIECQ